MILRAAAAVRAAIRGSRLPIRSVSTHQIRSPAANCSRQSFGKKVRSRRNSVSTPIHACDSKVCANAGSSSSLSIQIASGISLIRVYNLESIMTELDDAETRKGILGHRSVETFAGAIAGVAVSFGSG